MNLPVEKHKQVSQWIVSLSVSVLCCSVLFLIFSTYIMRLRDHTDLVTVRVDALNEIQNQVAADAKYLNHEVNTTKKEVSGLVKGSGELSASPMPESSGTNQQPKADMSPATVAPSPAPAPAPSSGTPPK